MHKGFFALISNLWIIGLLGTLSGNVSVYADEEKTPRSVYEVKPLRDGLLLGAAALVDVFPLINGYHFVYLNPNRDPQSVFPFDRHVIGNHNDFADHLSNATLIASVATPVLVETLDLGWNQVLFEDLLVYFQTLAINSAVTNFFKTSTQRPIPRVYEGDPDSVNSPEQYQAFYSGHTSTTLAALSALAFTLNLRHHTGAWPWIITAVIGTSVAVERVAAGKHFYTDVIAGALMGTAIGTLVPYLHERQSEGQSNFSITPAITGAKLTWTQHF